MSVILWESRPWLVVFIVRVLAAKREAMENFFDGTAQTQPDRGTRPLGSPDAIQGCNIGYQLLKKCGWKEGTGLGIAEQGRINPLETHVKQDKRGIGAEKKKKNLVPKSTIKKQEKEFKNKREKKLSKKLRKLQEEEDRLREKEFERAFFREFWADNV